MTRKFKIMFAFGAIEIMGGFKTLKAAQDKLRDLTERGIIAGIPVKIVEETP